MLKRFGCTTQLTEAEQRDERVGESGQGSVVWGVKSVSLFRERGKTLQAVVIHVSSQPNSDDIDTLGSRQPSLNDIKRSLQ